MKIIRPVDITGDKLLSTNAPADNVPNYDPAVSYSAGDRVIDVDMIYEAATSVSGVTPSVGAGQTPPTWYEVGGVNQRAMFNGVINDATVSGADFLVGDGRGIQVEIRPGRVINALAFFGIEDAEWVRVEVVDASEGVVYDTTRNLRSSNGIGTYYAWFFEPIERDSDVVFTDLPSYSATIRISIQASTGADAKAGLCIVGSIKDLGCTQYGMSVGSMSFSRRTRDDFGRVTLIKRDTAKLASYDVGVPKERSDALSRTLTKFDSVPLVWIGSEQFESSLVYGFYEDFRIVYSNFAMHNSTIEVVGLT